MKIVIFFIVFVIVSISLGDNGCGVDWNSANTQCNGRGCSGDSDCPSGQSCYSSVDPSACSGSSNSGSGSSGSGSTIRCGSSWDDANSGCGSSCTTNSDCSSGQSCYKDLQSCSSSTLSSSGSTPTCGFTYTVTNSDLQNIMESSADFSQFVSPLNTALTRYSMNCPDRIAVFLAQVRHETAGLTVFHQPIDNGGGSLHMTPSNWGYACNAIPEVAAAFQKVDPSCGSCSCLDRLAANPLSAETTNFATNVFSDPLVAFLSGCWWFASGASNPSIFGWKGCGDLRIDADAGLGAAGSSDCHHTGYYQVTCCIFWTISGSAGLDQRIRYLNVANSVASGWTTSSALEDSTVDQTLNDKKVLILGISCGVTGLIIIILFAIIFVMSRRASRIEVV